MTLRCLGCCVLSIMMFRSSFVAAYAALRSHVANISQKDLKAATKISCVSYGNYCCWTPGPFGKPHRFKHLLTIFLLSKSQSTSFNQCVSCSIGPWMLKSKLLVVGFRLWHLTKGDVWSWDSCHFRNGGILELQPAILTCPRSGEHAFAVIQAPRFLRR